MLLPSLEADGPGKIWFDGQKEKEDSVYTCVAIICIIFSYLSFYLLIFTHSDSVPDTRKSRKNGKSTVRGGR